MVTSMLRRSLLADESPSLRTGPGTKHPSIQPKDPMNNHLSFKRTLLAGAIALLACTTANAVNLPKAEYVAGKSRISADYKADRKACAALSANAKDICIEEAKVKEKVARAELEFNYTGKAEDATRVSVARAESTYAVAKEKCDDLAGNKKDVCVKEAKAVEVKALADARTAKTIGTARRDAAQDARDADFKVATEKCEAMAGDAKTACVDAAKAKFGKS
jgi:hypothetical protein